MTIPETGEINLWVEELQPTCEELVKMLARAAADMTGSSLKWSIIQKGNVIHFRLHFLGLDQPYTLNMPVAQDLIRSMAASKMYGLMLNQLQKGLAEMAWHLQEGHSPKTFICAE